MKNMFLLIAGILFWILPQKGHSAEILSAMSGSWSSTSTWIGGVIPGMNDTIRIQNGHIITVSTGSKSCHDLNVEAGGKLYSNSSSGNPRYIDVYGNISCDGTIGNGAVYDVLSFSVEGDTCYISGSGVMDVSRIKKTNTISINTLLFISMDVNLHYGGTALFDEESGTNLNIIIASGCTVVLTGNGNVGGGLSIDGTAGNGSTIGGSVTVNGMLTLTGRLYLTTNNSNTGFPVSFTVAPGGCVNADSVICIASGNAGHTLTLQAGGRFNLQGFGWTGLSTVNNNYLFLTGSVIEYSGIDGQVVEDPAAYGNLEITGSGLRNISGEVTVGGNLTIQSGSSLQVDPGQYLTVTGNCYLGDTACLVLKSPTGEGAGGSLIISGSITGIGSAKIERFIPKYTNLSDSKYHMISSPVFTQNIQPGFVSDPPSADVDFYRWDEETGTWTNTKNDAGQWNTSFQAGDDRTFHPGTGYLVAYPYDTIKAFRGTPNNTDQPVSVSYSPGGSEGFNLIGNPYSSALTCDIQNWNKSNVANAVWVWDDSAGNYLTWNGTLGSLTNGIVPAMQGFFIKTTGVNPSLTIPVLSRIHHNQSFYKSDRDPLLVLMVAGNNHYDRAFVCLKDSMVPGVDNLFDVIRMEGCPAAPQIWTVAFNAELSINGLPKDFQEYNIPVVIRIGRSGQYSLSISGGHTFPEGIQITLEDRLTGISNDLKPDRNLSLFFEAGTFNDRFIIRISRISEAESGRPPDYVDVFSHDNQLFIKGIHENSDPVSVSIFNLTGQLCSRSVLTSGNNNIGLDLSPGIYYIILTYNKSIITRKVFIGYEDNH